VRGAHTGWEVRLVYPEDCAAGIPASEVRVIVGAERPPDRLRILVKERVPFPFDDGPEMPAMSECPVAYHRARCASAAGAPVSMNDLEKTQLL